MTRQAAKTELFDGFARIGQALASGRRAEIIDILANGARTVESLSAAVGLSMANTSQHLQVLRRAGLVTARREGNNIRYSLAGDDVFALWSSLRDVAAHRSAEIEKLAAGYLGDPDALEPVTRDELYRRLEERPPPIIIDVRPSEEYDALHLKGAVSIPLTELRRRLREIPRDREVVAYCRGAYCVYAPEAVRLLRSKGYAARRLEDGLPEWRAAGLPVEVGDGRAGQAPAGGVVAAAGVSK